MRISRAGRNWERQPVSGWIERRKGARHSIELGGPVVKAGIINLTGDNRAMIYGTMIWIAEKLKSEDGGYAPGVWTSTRFFYPHQSISADDAA
nr:conjugal transfer protein TraD [Chelatococcus sp. HY11]